jgi:CubicO group peptidase (beta-lactamase class C family)
LRRLLFALLLLAPLGAQSRFDLFDQDLNRIRAELRIPHLSAAIVDSGRIVWRNDAATRMFPIASVTKTMTALLVMQLVEQHKLFLDDPIAKYDSSMGLPAQVSVRHVLSHTADGTPGEEYLYNGAIFNLLTAVVEKAGGQPFAQQLANRILRPLAMSHTDASHARASTGVMSTTADLAKYAIALDSDRPVSATAKTMMFTPTKSTRGKTLPYGLGWFSQVYLNERIVWHYGQETDSSSLFLRIPDRKLTLIALADSNAMSDAARLLDGNVARSPLALAFFKDVVFAGRAGAREFERDELENRALIAFYLGKRGQSAVVVKEALAKFPGMESSDDLTLLGLLAQLRMVETESCATAVMREHPYLAPAWYYFALYLLNARRYREATLSFERITEHEPPWHHWSVEAAKKELKQLQ